MARMAQAEQGALQTGLKTPTAEQTTTTAAHMGLKTPIVEQTTTTAAQMGLKSPTAEQTTTTVDLVKLETTMADQVQLEHRTQRGLHFSQALRESPRERAGVDTNIVGVGWSGTIRLQERAVLVRHSAGAGGCGFKKSVPRRAILRGRIRADRELRGDLFGRIKADRKFIGYEAGLWEV
ncbi:hypothetical protein DPX16_12645 [Anabarilius grahami]|uniref:Uncharacterized protein n=1 Tax=Anabarilius grahami TaxID=495550 RepID=A0A3N0YKG8_ANAGA|nr:hypothetical protein DPX16_12645 [Anabarilius grahami]